MLLAFKTTIKLDADQKDLIDKMSEEGRLLYNHFLGKIRNQYDLDKTYIPYFTQQKELKTYKTEYLTFDAKKDILRILHNNYSSFFSLIKKRKNLNPKPPRFRGKDYFFTLSFTQDFLVKDKNLRISQAGLKKLHILINYNDPIKGLKCTGLKTKESDIKQLKISKKEDKYFASFSYEKKSLELNDIDPKKVISIDLGKKNLLSIYDVGSNKGIVYSSKFLTKNQKHWDSLTDKLKGLRDKKKRGSRKYRKLDLKIGKNFSKKKTQINLALQKETKDLANQDKTILIGELSNLKNNILTNYRSINRQMQNNWNLQTFTHLLEYKCALKGNQVVKINEAWTSKTCCKCGNINHDLLLSHRQYICDCGNDINRDVNGAINIYKQFVGDYNPPFETLTVSEKFDWCHTRRMDRYQ
jgi:putative transposase